MAFTPVLFLRNGRYAIGRTAANAAALAKAGWTPQDATLEGNEDALDDVFRDLVTNPASEVRAALGAAFGSQFRRRDPAATIYLGDSITANNTTEAQRKYGEGFPAFTSMLLGQRLLFAANAGVTNDTVQQMAARLQTDVIAKAPGKCFVLAGTNNTNLGAAGPTLTQSMLDYENGIIVPLLAAGIEPIIGTIPPRSGTATGDAVTYKNTLRWNAFLHRLAQRRSLRLVDFYAALVNPATGDYAAGLSSDGVHPNPAGGLAMAQRAVADLGPALAYHGLPLTKDDLSTINMLAKGAFSSGMGGSRPTSWSSGWTNGAEGTISIVAKTGSLVGSWMQLAKTGTTGMNVNQIINAGTPFAVGDRIALLGKLEIDSVAGGAYLTIAANYRDAGAATLSSLTPVNQFASTLSDATFYAEGVVPAGTASIRLDIGTSAAGTGNFRVGQATLLNLTQLGI